MSDVTIVTKWAIMRLVVPKTTKEQKMKRKMIKVKMELWGYNGVYTSTNNEKER